MFFHCRSASMCAFFFFKPSFPIAPPRSSLGRFFFFRSLVEVTELNASHPSDARTQHLPPFVIAFVGLFSLFHVFFFCLRWYNSEGPLFPNRFSLLKSIAVSPYGQTAWFGPPPDRDPPTDIFLPFFLTIGERGIPAPPARQGLPLEPPPQLIACR